MLRFLPELIKRSHWAERISVFAWNCWRREEEYEYSGRPSDELESSSDAVRLAVFGGGFLTSVKRISKNE